jgi:hypothetical protein
MATAERLAVRLGRASGAALLVDYGRDAPYADSLVAIRGHESVPVRPNPLLAMLDCALLRLKLPQASRWSKCRAAVAWQLVTS